MSAASEGADGSMQEDLIRRESVDSENPPSAPGALLSPAVSSKGPRTRLLHLGIAGLAGAIAILSLCAVTLQLTERGTELHVRPTRNSVLELRRLSEAAQQEVGDASSKQKLRPGEAQDHYVCAIELVERAATLYQAMTPAEQLEVEREASKLDRLYAICRKELSPERRNLEDGR